MFCFGRSSYFKHFPAVSSQLTLTLRMSVAGMGDQDDDTDNLKVKDRTVSTPNFRERQWNRRLKWRKGGVRIRLNYPDTTREICLT